jgi:aspartate kinase
MKIIVQKFGGTSVGDISRILNVAEKVLQEVKRGNKVVVVVSAMSGETDRLIKLAKDINPDPAGDREYDVLISTGEQVTIGLLSLAIKKYGYKAKSFLGSHIPIITDSVFSKARILKIESDNLLKSFEEYDVAVVAGFQGVDMQGNITTLGRGGSDTTAVAIAAAIKAERCDIFTDVEGVFTTDPNICSNAKKIDRICYEEMLEFASLGAKVLQLRSVEFAKKYEVVLQVRSSFSDVEGTIVCKEDKSMESALVTGVAYDKNQAKISILRVPDRPGIASKVFPAIAENNINVDMIVQNISEENNTTDLTFTVSKEDYKKAIEITRKVADEIGADDVRGNDKISKVSVIGVGMRSHYGIASKMFKILSEEHINIMMISTSEIKISCIVDEKYTELAVRSLHEGFGLGEKQAEE